MMSSRVPSSVLKFSSSIISVATASAVSSVGSILNVTVRCSPSIRMLHVKSTSAEPAPALESLVDRGGVDICNMAEPEGCMLATASGRSENPGAAVTTAVFVPCSTCAAPASDSSLPPPASPCCTIAGGGSGGGAAGDDAGGGSAATGDGAAAGTDGTAATGGAAAEISVSPAGTSGADEACEMGAAASARCSAVTDAGAAVTLRSEDGAGAVCAAGESSPEVAKATGLSSSEPGPPKGRRSHSCSSSSAADGRLV
mmetsp:Transcript_9366/g.28417  ORF Transcript_9366/g.28417 Transcript_9366/m.28417 type:complete len:256 (-) Transcript_9366:888-1655(-)|eukprot:scaffold68212_cov31-Tisochrysis_lutea.AAC.3